MWILKYRYLLNIIMKIKKQDMIRCYIFVLSPWTQCNCCTSCPSSGKSDDKNHGPTEPDWWDATERPTTYNSPTPTTTTTTPPVIGGSTTKKLANYSKWTCSCRISHYIMDIHYY